MDTVQCNVHCSVDIQRKLMVSPELGGGQRHWAETLLPLLPAKTVYGSEFCLRQLKDPQNKQTKKKSPGTNRDSRNLG